MTRGDRILEGFFITIICAGSVTIGAVAAAVHIGVLQW